MTTLHQAIDATIARNDANTIRAKMRLLRAKQVGQPRKHWHYFGDVNIECGGYFYDMSNWKWGYVEAWRVVPCSDAGGPDNEFWIESLTVNIPKAKDAWAALAKVSNEDVDLYRTSSPRMRKHVLVNALICYGSYDMGKSTRIRIGKKQSLPGWSCGWGDGDLHKLHGRTTLANYIKRVLSADEIV
jgi:hypothetical protein